MLLKIETGLGAPLCGIRARCVANVVGQCIDPLQVTI
jgi:hypothetical protein